MKLVTLRKINFFAFINLSSFIHFSFGIILGLICFIFSFFSKGYSVEFGTFHLAGISAGIADLFIIPIFFLLLGAFVGLFAYFPFKMLINRFGLTLLGNFETEEDEEKQETQEADKVQNPEVKEEKKEKDKTPKPEPAE